MSHRDTYERYREVGTQLNSDILDVYSERELLLDSAETLGIDHDGTNIFYDYQSDMTVHYEFLLYEYQWNGTTVARRYYEQEHWETDTERTILEARLEADTSLFEITAVDEAESQLEVTDVLNDGRGYTILDMSLSRTAEPGPLLFFRPVEYGEFAKTSGVFLPFPNDERERLLTEYENRGAHLEAAPSSLRRYVAFYDLYRDFGIHVQYQ
ncbi:MAG: hypothetical protein ABEH61_04895 [Haloarculaceae archaeon]